MVDFLLIGPINTVCYKNVAKLFIDDKINVGNSMIQDFEDGKKVAAYWYTTFDVQKNPIELKCVYDEGKYYRYINYDAINVDNINDIPSNYDGVMGVPITFMRLYDRRQFEIVSFCDYDSDLLLWKESDDIVKEMKKTHKSLRLIKPIIQGDEDVIILYYRVFIRKR